MKVYGKTPTGGRQEHDYYATEPMAVKLLLNQECFDQNIWESASGENHIANVLREYGYNVRTSDIVKWTPTTEQKDFLKSAWRIVWRDEVNDELSSNIGKFIY